MYSSTSTWLVVKVCVISSYLQHGVRLWILCLTFIYDNCKRSWLRVEVLFWSLLVSSCTQIKGHNKYLFNYIRNSGFEIRFSLASHLSHWTWPMRETWVAVNVINGILGSRENWAQIPTGEFWTVSSYKKKILQATEMLFLPKNTRKCELVRRKIKSGKHNQKEIIDISETRYEKRVFREFNIHATEWRQEK